MGIEGWKCMAETQESFLAEDRALGRTRRTGSPSWGGLCDGQWGALKGLGAGGWGAAWSHYQKITVKEGTGLAWRRQATGPELRQRVEGCEHDVGRRLASLR